MSGTHEETLTPEGVRRDEKPKETLTPEQAAAVENRGGQLLVSAAAGSGKTKVLVERLFQYVQEEHKNLDDFLIITYTKAAAAELRGKIAGELSKRVGENPSDLHLRRQMLRVYQADIKTVDSFCTALLRENTHLLARDGDKHALTPDFRVMDEPEAALLRERMLRRTLETFYENLTPGGALLADTMGAGRDDRQLSALALEVYEKLQSHAWPLEWLRRSRQAWEALQNSETSFDATPYAVELLTVVHRRAAYWETLLREGASRADADAAIKKGYGDKFLIAAGGMNALANVARWDSAAQVADLVTFPRVTTPKGRKDDPLIVALTAVWKRCKDGLKALQKTLRVSGADAMDDLRKLAPAMLALLDLVSDFSEAYRLEKLRINAADFPDQEHLALQLLVSRDGSPTETGRQISQRYAEILVDEYQDTNEVQNAIFRAVSRDGQNLFVVGDVKQSIYRFRLADPTIFLKKYAAFLPYEQARDGQERKILLSRNFRSRREILDATNFVFTNILSPEMGEMSYGAEESLYFGAEYYPPRDDCATEFHLISARRRGADDDPDAPPVRRVTAEARFVARRIRELLDGAFPVTTPDGMRPCRPEDVVILMRSPRSRTAAFFEALAEQNIPCSFDESGGLFDTMEVSTAFALLQIADNPRQDVPLIAVLRSPIFAFTPDRLAEIRARRPQGDFYDALRAAAGLPDDSNVDAVPDDNDNTDADAETRNPPKSPLSGGTSPDSIGPEMPVPPPLKGEGDRGRGYDTPDAAPHNADADTNTDADADCIAFLDTLSELRRAAPDMGVYEFYCYLCARLNLLGLFGAMDAGEERRENLLSFGRHAERFEANGYRGLFAFVTQIRRLIDAGRMPQGDSGAHNGVRLMSIHKSKGLEFPVVILADLDHKFSRQDFDAPVLVHPELGLGPRYVDLKRRIRYPTLARVAVEERLRRENLAEEQRILYVAMTRPKEKLIMVDTVYNAPKRLRELASMTGVPVRPESVADGKSFGDWLLMALLTRPEASAFRADAGTEPDTLWNGADLPWETYSHDAEDFRDIPAAVETVHDAAQALTFTPSLLSWKYPYGAETALPAKLTATQLKGRPIDEEIAENAAHMSAFAENAAPALRPAETAAHTSASAEPAAHTPALRPDETAAHTSALRPDEPAAHTPALRPDETAAHTSALRPDEPAAHTSAFAENATHTPALRPDETAAHTPALRPLSQPKFRWEAHGLTPAECGTASHLLLQHLDFSGPDAAAQASELVAKRLLTPEQADAVNFRAIDRFLSSPLADEIRHGRNVRREYRFTLLMDASEYDPRARAGDSLLLQGVVDCCFETDDGITVVDFKTDRVRDPEALAARAEAYKPQLRAYSDALRRVLERPVTRRVLYFLDPGAAVDV